jgi:prevent-host-death family protein
MKTMTVFEARNNFSRTLDAAEKDVVIVTRNGRPVAAIQRIDDDDLEDFLLERSEKFWKMIQQARRGKAVSLDSVRKDLVKKPSAPKGRRPRNRG